MYRTIVIIGKKSPDRVRKVTSRVRICPSLDQKPTEIIAASALILITHTYKYNYNIKEGSFMDPLNSPMLTGFLRASRFRRHGLHRMREVFIYHTANEE